MVDAQIFFFRVTLLPQKRKRDESQQSSLAFDARVVPNQVSWRWSTLCPICYTDDSCGIGILLLIGAGGPVVSVSEQGERDLSIAMERMKRKK